MSTAVVQFVATRDTHVQQASTARRRAHGETATLVYRLAATTAAPVPSTTFAIHPTLPKLTAAHRSSASRIQTATAVRALQVGARTGSSLLGRSLSDGLSPA